MQTHWDSSTDIVRTTYGEEYFEDFKVRNLWINFLRFFLQPRD
jgi:hypothetical protein